jgi:predicted dehydrogenase
MSKIHLTRREFSSGLATGLSMLSSKSLALGQKGPNDQIVIGMIGVGLQGTGRLKEFLKLPDVRIGAICDVDKSHLQGAVSLVEAQKGYKPLDFGDFRKLLETKELDAVSIVTPDHWHAIPTINAFEAGKDVFVEKPLSYTVAEGRAMADATLRYKRVSQMGNHIHNDFPNYRRVVEIVKSGKLGKIVRVHAWKTGPVENNQTKNPPQKPDELDYDFWLGPAPKHAYEPLRSHFTYRYFWDYSGGSFIDYWCHIADVAFWGMDFDAPKTISSVGGRYVLTDSTETSDNQEAVFDFGNVIFTYSFRSTPPLGLEHMGGIGCVFEGQDASVVTNYKDHEVWSRGKKVEDFTPPAPSIPDSPGHLREFVDAIKSRNLETTCNLRYGHHLTKYGLLANISYRTGRSLQWDDKKEQIVGDKEANAYLERNYRGPWQLKKQPKQDHKS